MHAELVWRTRLHTIFDKSLHDARRGIIGWSIGMVVFAGYVIALFPTIRDNKDLKKLLDQYPEALRAMLSLRDMTTGPGYVQAELFSFMAPIALIIFAVLNASDATCGEEERRTIDLLMANPVRRRQVVVEKFAALVVGLVVVNAALLSTLAIGGAAVGLGIPLSRLVAVTTLSTLLAVSLGAIALAIGAATGRRGLARGVTVAFAFASYLLSALSGLVKGLRPFRPLSLYWHTLGTEPIFNGFPVGHVVVVLLVIMVAVVLAAAAFERRDLAV